MGGPDGMADGEGEPPLVTEANTDSRRRASGWPWGQLAGSPDSAMGRFSSKVSSQVVQRYSYVGTGRDYPFSHSAVALAILAPS